MTRLALSRPRPGAIRSGCFRPAAVGMLLLVAGCRPKDEVRELRTDAQGTLLAVGQTEGNIVPASNPVHFHFHTPLEPQTVRPRVETWSPGVEDIRRFERGLAAHLRASIGAHLQRVGTPSEDSILRDYRRQYVGLIVEGRKLLHVELFSPWLANRISSDWRSSEFNMVDVGMGWLWFDVEVTRDELIQMGYSGDA